ncbi:MAG: hypothetical protein R3F28_06385 [Candidatus Kapaibacterium sp.]|nr:hypothetical protein [Ignavibacteria bacterium]
MIANRSVWSRVRSAAEWLRDAVAAAGSMIAIIALYILHWLWEGTLWIGRQLRRVHTATGDMKRTLISVGVVSSALFAYIYLFAVEVSALAAGPLLAWVGIVMFYVVVKFGHREIDLIQELKEGNSAVVYHFRSYAILIALLLAAPVLALAL